MRVVFAAFLLFSCCVPAAGFGFSLGGSQREFSYPTEPQYMYPGKHLRKCPKGFTPYHDGKCRKIRWLR
jgi:hypothetical protein